MFIFIYTFLHDEKVVWNSFVFGGWMHAYAFSTVGDCVCGN